MRDRGLDVVFGAMAVWVIVVIVGAGATADSETWLGTKGIDTAMQIAVLVIVVAMAVFTLLVLLSGSAGGERQGRRRNSYGSMIVAIALLVLFSIWQPDFRRDAESDAAAPELASTPAGPDVEPETTVEPVAPEAAFELVNIVIVAAVLAVGAAVISLWRLRKRLRDDDVGTSFDEARRAAVRAAHDQLLTVTDPRTAVIAAYAELERALAAREQRRGEAETAAEYLTRIVDGSPLNPEPFRVLGRAYDRARFSTDAISPADRDLAQGALASALDEMGPAPVDVMPESG